MFRLCTSSALSHLQLQLGLTTQGDWGASELLRWILNQGVHWQLVMCRPLPSRGTALPKLPNPGEEVQYRDWFLQKRQTEKKGTKHLDQNIADRSRFRELEQTDQNRKQCLRLKERVGGNITLVDLILLKTFQKRSVSSPAPVTMASPSGDIAYRKKKQSLLTENKGLQQCNQNDQGHDEIICSFPLQRGWICCHFLCEQEVLMDAK